MPLAYDVDNYLYGKGRLYYTAHLEVYQPVEALEPADRGFSIQRRYTLASCAAEKIKAGGSVLLPFGIDPKLLMEWSVRGGVQLMLKDCLI